MLLLYRELSKKPKGVSKGVSKGKSVPCHVTRENMLVPEQSIPPPLSANGIECWQDGNTFTQVMKEYSVWKEKRKLSPKKNEKKATCPLLL